MSDSFLVVLTDRAWPDANVEREIVERNGGRFVDLQSTDPVKVLAATRDADAIGTHLAKINAEVLAHAPRLKTVVRMGIGLDNIDVDGCTRRKIPVTNSPAYCVEEVADHAMALLLALTRKIAFYHLRTKRDGEYDPFAGPAMSRLRGRTLGLFGLGNTGKAMYQRARAFGLRVIAHNRSSNDGETGCPMVDLPTLLAESDYLSLHAPLTPTTRNLINAETLSSMKRGAVLINISRGGLVNENDLWQAIESGQLAGAGLDVTQKEPCDLTQPLFRNERVIVTPHAAFISNEALIEMRQETMQQVVDVLQGRRPDHVVNPAVY